VKFPVFPVPLARDGRVPHITSGYGPRTGGMYDFHYGVDILYPRRNEPAGNPQTSASGRWAMPNDVAAVAVAPGIVTKSSWTGTGDRVRIDHGAGIASAYMHLRDRQVHVGDRVRAGQPVGTISYNPWKRGAAKAEPPPAPPRKVGLNHLHFEVYKNGVQVDPRPYLTDAKYARQTRARTFLLYAGLAVALGLIVAPALSSGAR
jgi:murein DD-endopeptidase MepM/ murein hydrolase activator NlpD